jgi:hypothetical protein
MVSCRALDEIIEVVEFQPASFLRILRLVAGSAWRRMFKACV